MRALRGLLPVATVLAVMLAGCSGGPAPESAARRSSPSSPAAAAAPPAPAGPALATETCTVPRRFVGQDVSRMPVTEKLVALTFDAGANADGLPSIRATLSARHVPATFFLTGRFVRTFPRKSARIGAEHLVGNHTDTHPHMTTLTDDQVRAQVRRAQDRIVARTGQDPRRFFRFPYGEGDAHLVALLNQLCYVPFRWTVDTLGWKGTSGGMTADKVVARVLAAARPGEIVLMHVGSNPEDGTTLDADALPRVVHQLRERGYTLVRLSRVMSAAP